MGLLKWRDNPRGLETYLRLFMKVDGEEIVKVEEGFYLGFFLRLWCFINHLLTFLLSYL